MRILIVDDSLMMRQLLATHLTSLGYQNIGKATNGVDAMSQLVASYEVKEPYDLILLDWGMPQLNGFDFLRQCRSDDRFAQTAIVMTTAEREQQNVLAALEAGATAYLVKPYNLPALQEKLEQVVEWLKSPKAALRAKKSHGG